MLETRLQMRLENGEPKCANCKHWEADDKNTDSVFGSCGLFVSMIKATADERDFLPSITQLVAMTTDLTVCSRWKQKD